MATKTPAGNACSRLTDWTSRAMLRRQHHLLHAMTTERLAILRGHAEAVLCCETAASQPLLATGSEDGTICLHDLRSNALQQRIQASKDEAVTSLAFQPTNEHHIWCSTGNSINLFDVRQTGASALLHQQSFTSAEINCIASSADGNTITAVDDDGCVTLSSQSDQAPPSTLNGRHENICSSVVYRRHEPMQVITGGLDCTMIQWDTSARSMLSARNIGDSLYQLCNAGNEERQSEAKVCNPPMIHGLAVPPTDEAPAAHLVAAACGDGHIRIWDLEKVTSNKNTTRARQRRPVCVLGQDSPPHRSAATCVQFVDASAARLISGGNDRQLQLWAWQASTHRQVAAWQLKRKVNAIALHGDQVYVADTSKYISVYALSIAGAVSQFPTA